MSWIMGFLVGLLLSVSIYYVTIMNSIGGVDDDVQALQTQVAQLRATPTP